MLYDLLEVVYKKGIEAFNRLFNLLTFSTHPPMTNEYFNMFFPNDQ